MPKPIELPPAAAKAFVQDMKAFFKAKGQHMQDEIAAKQVWLLKAAPAARDEPAD